MGIPPKYHISKFPDLFNVCEKDLENLKEKSLPSKKTFFSNLNDKGTFHRNHKHAQRVWNVFKIKEIEDYVFLCNVQDALTSLAVDIDFMKTVRAKFNLNPLNFVTLTSLSWECTLKITKNELKFSY